MMKIWMVHDTYYQGGHYSVYRANPNMNSIQPTEDECRTMTIPDALWTQTMNVPGGLPIDNDESNDSTWGPYWNAQDAVVVWKRTVAVLRGTPVTG